MSRIPNFANVSFEAASQLQGFNEARVWTTPEGIDVKSLYGPADIATGSTFSHDWPGSPPYLRGPYPTMYVNQPWTVRQYAGFSTAEEFQRLLSRQSRRRPEGPLGRLRSGDPSRL